MRWIILSHFTCLLTASLEWSRQESIQFGLSPFWEIRQSSDPHRTGDAPTAHRSNAENEAAPTDLILYKAVCSIQKEHWTPEVTQWAIKETPHWLWQLNLFIFIFFIFFSSMQMMHCAAAACSLSFTGQITAFITNSHPKINAALRLNKIWIEPIWLNAPEVKW